MHHNITIDKDIIKEIQNNILMENNKKVVDLIKKNNLKFADYQDFILLAAQIGNLDIIKDIINIGGTLFVDLLKKKKMYSFDMPVHIASYHGHIEIVKYLIENGVYHEEKEYDKESLTNLLREKMLERTYEDGIMTNLNYYNTESNFGNEYQLNDDYISKNDTPINCAIKGGHVDIMKYLIGIYDSKYRSDKYKDYINCAIRNNKVGIVDYFVKEENYTITANDIKESMKIAVERNYFDVIKYCMRNIKDSENNGILLICSVDNDNHEMFELLLNYNFNLYDTIIGKMGTVPLKITIFNYILNHCGKKYSDTLKQYYILRKHYQNYLYFDPITNVFIFHKSLKTLLLSVYRKYKNRERNEIKYIIKHVLGRMLYFSK